MKTPSPSFLQHRSAPFSPSSSPSLVPNPSGSEEKTQTKRVSGKVYCKKKEREDEGEKNLKQVKDQ